MILGCNITMEEYGQVQRENGRLEGLQEGASVRSPERQPEGRYRNPDSGQPGRRDSKGKDHLQIDEGFQLTEEEACNYYMQTTKDLTKDL